MGMLNVAPHELEMMSFLDELESELATILDLGGLEQWQQPPVLENPQHSEIAERKPKTKKAQPFPLWGW